METRKWGHPGDRRSLLILVLALAGCGADEGGTSGTMTIELHDTVEARPVGGIVVLVKECWADEACDDLTLGFQSDSSGVINYSWGWIGGGSQYSARLVIVNPAFAPVDTIGIFPIDGGADDNHLMWEIPRTPVADDAPPTSVKSP